MYSIQQIFDRLNQSNASTLVSDGQGSYVNMHGIYVSTLNGTILFFTFGGSKTTLRSSLIEITNINSAGRNGLMMVQYYINETTVLNNNGTPSNPLLVEMLQFPVPRRPYHCFLTSQVIYITYCDNQILFSTHYRSNGLFVRNRNYSTSANVSERNSFHYDYAGRLYVCNNRGDSLGVHVFVNNNTRIATSLQSCSRSVQIYIRKEEIISVANSPTAMKKIEI